MGVRNPRFGRGGGEVRTLEGILLEPTFSRFSRHKNIYETVSQQGFQ